MSSAKAKGRDQTNCGVLTTFLRGTHEKLGGSCYPLVNPACGLSDLYGPLK